MRSDDVRFVTAPVDQGLWAAPAGPGAGVAGDLLGLSDDVRFRKAERLYVRGHLPATTFAAGEGTARGSRRRRRAARADDERAIRSRGAGPGPRTCSGSCSSRTREEGRELAPTLSRQAVRAFSTGARQAEGADEPRFNLEILLTQLRPNGLIGRDLSQNQAGLANGFGAGLAIPEKGY